MAEAEHRRGGVTGTKLREAVGVRSRGPGRCAEDFGSQPEGDRKPPEGFERHDLP